MEPEDVDATVRAAAFGFLRDQQAVYSDVFPRDILAGGFLYGGRRVPLIGPQGIFKPAVLSEVPLSITTAPVVEGAARPYEDQIGYDVVLYRYRGTDPAHRDNVGLRLAMQRQTPLIYFIGLVPGLYMPSWPVYVVGDDRARLTFTVQVGEAFAGGELSELIVAEDARRGYLTRLVRQRSHQAGFRVRVLRAYQMACSVCRLRHLPLLDAAHILPDREPAGVPSVSNGLALCKLHHAAFDSNILGIRPDLRVEIREDVLDEIDGPMLKHGLQGVHGGALIVPRHVELRPLPEFIEERYERFRKAG